MSLEKQLAEIEVLADEVVRRSVSTAVDKGNGHLTAFEHAVQALRNDPALIYANYRTAKKALKKDVHEASRSITEFCLNTKNLADSLNIFLQVLYGDKEPDLKKLQSNTSKAPKTIEGTNLFEVHNRSHDHSTGSVNALLRNMKAHGRGYSALQASPNGSGCYIKIRTSAEGDKDFRDADDWLENQIQSYFGMTQTILETISDRDESIIHGKKDFKRKSATVQRLKNWKKRHQTPVLIGLAAALVASGVVGTLSYQKMTEKDRLVYEGNEIRNLVFSSFITQSGDLWSRDVEYKKYTEVLNGISNRIDKIGKKLDYTIVARRSLSKGSLSKEVEEQYSSFTNLKLSIDSELKGTYSSIVNNPNPISNLQKISSLLYMERQLGEVENNLMNSFEWRRAYNFDSSSPSNIVK